MTIDGVEIDDDGFVGTRKPTFDPSEREVRIAANWLENNTMPVPYKNHAERSHNLVTYWPADELARMIHGRTNVKVSVGAVMVGALRLGIDVAPHEHGTDAVISVTVRDGNRMLRYRGKTT